VQRKYFVLFLKQTGLQLVDDYTCGTIPFPLFREKAKAQTEAKATSALLLMLMLMLIFFIWLTNQN
jgi:hypothetical protein